MVKAHWSKNAKAVQSRIKRLPKMMIAQMKARALGDSRDVIREFQDGLKRRNLGLKVLKQATVRSKELYGNDYPDNPLVAIGLNEKDSYINSLEVKEIGKRLYSVQPREAWHHGKRHSGDPRENRIRLKDLFDVHEYGSVISTGGVLVRIPPRPALRYAFNRYMRAKAASDPSVAVRAAIAKNVQDGNTAALNRIRDKLEKGWMV